jgi:hypothetical protein
MKSSRQPTPRANAARRLLEIASSMEPDTQGRIFVERLSAIFLNEGGDTYDYRAGVARLTRDGLIEMHETGTFFRFTEKGAETFE